MRLILILTALLAFQSAAASEFDEIAPDILCIAKGLGAGYQPIGAMLCSKNIYNRLGKGSGFFQHGHTYMGHPVACAAALAVLKAILNRKLLSSIKSKSDQLFNCLETQLGHHPNIGDIRGRGLFIGIEIVKNIFTIKNIPIG